MGFLPISLSYFQAVARSGSVSSATQELHVSASAISRQISKLENAVGVPLFERQPRGMTLTEAGYQLLAHTRRTDLESEAVLDDIRRLNTEERSVVRVASSEGFARHMVPRAISTSCHPEAKTVFLLDVMSSVDATRRVVDGEADVAVVYALGPQRGVTVEYSAAMPVVAMVAKHHPLAGLDEISLATLCTYPLALPNKGVSQRDLFDSAAEMEQVTAQIVLVCDHAAPLREFVLSGEGVTMLSDVAAGRDDDVSYIRVRHPIFSQRQGQVQTMTGRRQSPATLKFLAALIDVLPG